MSSESKSSVAFADVDCVRNQVMERKVALGDFLRSRRARLKPQDIGLTPSPRRRARGLRREEVARLACISTDYYGRLEQGRTINVSQEILNAVARALLLDEHEHEHLFFLAFSMTPSDDLRIDSVEQRVRPETLRLINSFTEFPACILGFSLDLLARNAKFDIAFRELAQVLTHEPNLARAAFLEPSMREKVSDWDTLGRGIVALLRRNAYHSGYNEEIIRLAEEISNASWQFREWWDEYPLWRRDKHLIKLLNPDTGFMELEVQCVTIPEIHFQTLLFCSPPSGSTTSS